MSLKVVFYNAGPDDQTYFADQLKDGYELVMIDGDLTEDTVAAAVDAQAISVRVTSTVTGDFMKRMPKLRHIATRTTGFDHIDLSYARAHDISISTVPAYGENTIAEYAFMLMLATTRRTMLSAHSVRFGGGTTEKLMGHDLAGKTLGVVGAGRIGQHAARIGRGFGMTVLAYDVYEKPALAQEIGFSYAPLDELLASSDYLTLHAPATPETHHLLGREALARTKAGVYVVNTGRGALIDTPALVDALQSGHVGGAGLDVLEGEEYLRMHPRERQAYRAKATGDEATAIEAIEALMLLPNVLITAHNGANSVEAAGRIRTTAAANLKAWHENKPQNLLSA